MIAVLAIGAGYLSLLWEYGWPAMLAVAFHVLVMVGPQAIKEWLGR